MTTLHDRIRDHRKKLGLSQIDLARKCGVSQPTVANWERGGHVPRQEALAKIANCLGVETVWLLSGELPANRTPSLAYLNSPIRHVPIFNWTDNATAFSKADPIRYISLSISAENVFAIIPPKIEGEETDTILIFETQSHITENAHMLMRQDDILVVKQAEELTDPYDTPLARLTYTIKMH